MSDSSAGVEEFKIFGDLLFHWTTFHWGIETFLSMALVASVVALVCFLTVVSTARKNGKFYSAFGALLVVALFGALVGFHGGNSRVGAVGDLIPAVVTLVAGFAAYMFGLPGKEPGPYLFPMLGSFIVTLFMSWSIGAANNAGNEQHAKLQNQCIKVFGNPEILGSEIALKNAKAEFGEFCMEAFGE